MEVFVNKIEKFKIGFSEKSKSISNDRVEIDKLVQLVENEFWNLHYLYKSFTRKITGYSYDWFYEDVVNYKDVLTLDGLRFNAKDHGWGKAFFLTYTKKTSWWKPNKHKIFYCSSDYNFHAERTSSDRYNFSIEDYQFILSVLKNECELLQSGINVK